MPPGQRPWTHSPAADNAPILQWPRGAACPCPPRAPCSWREHLRLNTHNTPPRPALPLLRVSMRWTSGASTRAPPPTLPPCPPLGWPRGRLFFIAVAPAPPGRPADPGRTGDAAVPLYPIWWCRLGAANTALRSPPHPPRSPHRLSRLCRGVGCHALAGTRRGCPAPRHPPASGAGRLPRPRPQAATKRPPIRRRPHHRQPPS